MNLPFTGYASCYLNLMWQNNTNNMMLMQDINENNIGKVYIDGKKGNVTFDNENHIPAEGQDMTIHVSYQKATGSRENDINVLDSDAWTSNRAYVIGGVNSISINFDLKLPKIIINNNKGEVN